MVLSNLLGEAEGSRSTGFTVWGFWCHNLWLCPKGTLCRLQPGHPSSLFPPPLPHHSPTKISKPRQQITTTNSLQKHKSLKTLSAKPLGGAQLPSVCFPTPLPLYRPQHGVGAGGGRWVNKVVGSCTAKERSVLMVCRAAGAPLPPHTSASRLALPPAAPVHLVCVFPRAHSQRVMSEVRNAGPPCVMRSDLHF